MMRPYPATWFEILAAKDDALAIAEALAARGCAEFEAAAPAAADPQRARLQQRFRDLERRCQAWWPPVALPVPRCFPTAALARAVGRIEAWAAAAAAPIASLGAASGEIAALEPWQDLLAVPGLGPGERAALCREAPLGAALYAWAGDLPPGLPAGLLTRSIAAGGREYLLALGPPQALARLGEPAAAAGAVRLAVPPWIAAPDARDRLAAALARAREEAAAARDALAALDRDHSLAEAVAEARWGCWCLDKGAAQEEGRVLCRFSGWTADPVALRRALGEARALLRFPAPPDGLQAPLLLYNPWWARPYEAFSGLLGMPGRDAADPSAAVALLFPLLFGYMFGDFGQGLLLTAAGAVAGERWPLAKLFIPAGLSAAFFGLVFGSVFSLAGILDPLWVEPLEAPLVVLLVPLLGGAALLLAGLLLAGVEARWQGQFLPWLRRRGGALALYLGLVALLAHPAGVPLAILAAGVALALALGEGLQTGRLGAVFAALGGSLEETVRLAINTISFVRVGAFAIAHAGLSAALGLLADAAGGTGAAVLVTVVGNLLIIALEVLVVSVQATRLLLFEFFTRFFVPSGRAFHPAALPEARHEA